MQTDHQQDQEIPHINLYSVPFKGGFHLIRPLGHRGMSGEVLSKDWSAATTARLDLLAQAFVQTNPQFSPSEIAGVLIYDSGGSARYQPFSSFIAEESDPIEKRRAVSLQVLGEIFGLDPRSLLLVDRDSSQVFDLSTGNYYLTQKQES